MGQTQCLADILRHGCERKMAGCAKACCLTVCSVSNRKTKANFTITWFSQSAAHILIIESFRGFKSFLECLL